MVDKRVTAACGHSYWVEGHVSSWRTVCPECGTPYGQQRKEIPAAGLPEAIAVKEIETVAVLVEDHRYTILTPLFPVLWMLAIALLFSACFEPRWIMIEFASMLMLTISVGAFVLRHNRKSYDKT